MVAAFGSLGPPSGGPYPPAGPPCKLHPAPAILSLWAAPGTEGLSLTAPTMFIIVVTVMTERTVSTCHVMD